MKQTKELDLKLYKDNRLLRKKYLHEMEKLTEKLNSEEPLILSEAAVIPAQISNIKLAIQILDNMVEYNNINRPQGD